jgi:hypothetical protein
MTQVICPSLTLMTKGFVTDCHVTSLYFFSFVHDIQCYLVCEHNLFRKCVCNPKHSYIKASFSIRSNGNSVVPKLKNIHIKMINTKYVYTFLYFEFNIHKVIEFINYWVGRLSWSNGITAIC